MSRARTITLGAIGTAILLTCTGTASATLFSFASDDDSNFPTLNGTNGSSGMFRIRNGRFTAPTPVTLNVDDDNGLRPTAQASVGLVVDFTAVYVSSTAFGSLWTHHYAVTGSYSFVHPVSNVPLLTVTVNNGAELAIVGSPTTWGSAGTINGSDVASGGPNGVNYIDQGFGAYLTSLGFTPSQYGYITPFMLEDFAFTMTNANADGGGIGLDSAHLPLTSWGSEASHSGRALGVPAPSAGALAGVLGLAAATRRRRK